MRKLPDWIDAYLEYTRDDEPCQLFRLWTAISTVAAAMQRKCYHKIARTVFYPNLYVALVGQSGSRKTTAIMSGKSLLDDIGVELAADVTSKERLIQRLEEITNASDADFLGKARSSVLNVQVIPHSSLTAVASELSVLFPSNDKDFAGYLIKLFDCEDRFDYQTKTKGCSRAENVWFNIIGGITPQELRRKLTPEVVGSGLVGRFIFVCSYERPKRRAFPVESEDARKIRSDLVYDLREILALSGAFKPTDEWKELYIPWYETTDASTQQEDNVMAAYYNRRGAYVHKLSMISCASRDSSKLMRGEDFRRALTWLEEVEGGMKEILQGIDVVDQSQVIPNVLQYLRGMRAVKFKTLLSQFMYVKNKEEMLQLIGTLRAAGKVRVLKEKGVNDPEELIIQYVFERE